MAQRARHPGQDMSEGKTWHQSGSDRCELGPAGPATGGRTFLPNCSPPSAVSSKPTLILTDRLIKKLISPVFAFCERTGGPARPLLVYTIHKVNKPLHVQYVYTWEGYCYYYIWTGVDDSALLHAPPRVILVLLQEWISKTSTWSSS